MEKLTVGYQKLEKENKVKPITKEQFESDLKKVIPKKQPSLK